MARLPTPGGDDDQWGTILNDYLSQGHNTDGTHKPLAQSNITNLSSDLAAKADDTDVVHIAGSETVTGPKDYTGGLTINSENIVVDSDTRLDDARLTVQDNGTDIGLRRNLNLIEGSNVTLTIADDSSNDAVDVTIASSGTSEIGSSFTAVTPSGTDDTAAIQTALNNGDVLLLSTGVDFQVGMVTYSGSESRRIFALGPVTIIQTDPDGVFSLRGTWDDLGSISSIATVTNADLVYPGESNPVSSQSHISRLTMSSATTVTRGEIVKVVSDDENPWARPSVSATKNRLGEYSTVGVSSTGTTVSLSNVLIETYTTSPRLARLGNSSFRIEGPITFDTDASIRETTVFGAVIELRSARDCFIGGGVKFLNSLGRAIGNFTYGCQVDGVVFRNLANRPSKSQYGYGIQDGGWKTRMSNCHGERLRHLYSEGIPGVTTGSTDFEYFGGGSFALIANCVAMNCESQPFDTHGTSYGVTFVGCSVYGSFQGADSNGSGYASRGRFTTFQSCFVEGSFRGFAIGGHSTQVIDCIALRCRYSALEIGADTSDSSNQTTQDSHIVSGGVFETTASSRTLRFASTAGYTIGVYVQGATFRVLAPANGHEVLSLGGSASETSVTCKLQFRNIVVDFRKANTAVSTLVVYARSDSIHVRGNGLRIEHEGSSVSGCQILHGNGASAGYGADLEVENIVWDSGNLSPTIVNSSMTNTRYSSYARVNTGGSWFHHSYSHDTNIASAASATLPIARLLDRSITCRITGGSSASVTFSSIPSTARQNGAQLTVVNKSTDTVSLNSVSIAPNAAARWIYSGGSWQAA